MHVKKGDNVIITTGKDRGKTGVVVRSLPQEEKVVVEGLNLVKKTLKGREGSGIIDVAMPVHASNVKLVETSKKGSKAKKASKKEKAEEK